MAWSKRTPERLYAIAMWIVSLILTGFLIGMGGLIIADLPRIDDRITIDQFIDQDAAETLARQEVVTRESLAVIESDVRAATDALETERGNYEAAYAQFQNWLATRRATTDPAQDPEVIARTNALDILKQRERAAERNLEALQRAERAARDEMVNVEAERLALFEAARPRFERARSNQELRVFGFRLALTLPLLAIAFWLTAKKRSSRYWPLMRGFVIFAAFAFFVELVPYLPSYGGYVRYGVGVGLTLLAGHYLIKWMRAYLDSRKEAERQSEETRRKSVAYEDALKKLSDEVCPGCDRKILTTGEATADFCVHCGMHLFDRCPNCESRKASFYRYCMVCGEKAAPETAAPAVA
ncbi:MAG: zinc ribbon domain-containing protein [Pseudomonadota bacterium]